MDRALALWNKTVPQTDKQRRKRTIFSAMSGIRVHLDRNDVEVQESRFAQEDEWRVLLITWAQEIQNPVRHRNRSGGEVPYVEWAFRPEYLDEVLIGPGPYGMNEELPHEILAACGMAHVQITRSTIPSGNIPT